MNYFEQMENKDNINFTQFNDRMEWFTTMTRQPQMSQIDWFCTDKYDRNVSVELKLRYNYINTYETTYIEVSKYDALIQKWNDEEYIPIYLNFFQSVDYVGVWDLRNFNNLEKVNVTIYNPGKNCYENVERYMLPNRECYYYEWNFDENKYVKLW